MTAVRYQEDNSKNIRSNINTNTNQTIYPKSVLYLFFLGKVSNTGKLYQVELLNLKRKNLIIILKLKIYNGGMVSIKIYEYRAKDFKCENLEIEILVNKRLDVCNDKYRQKKAVVMLVHPTKCWPEM